MNTFLTLWGHTTPLQSRTRDSPVTKDTNSSALSLEAKLLWWHVRLGHLSYWKIRFLELLDIIPQRLAKFKPFKCTGCIYATMTNRSWRTKIHKESHIKTVDQPGQCVSVDQLQSFTPSFVAQLKG